MTTSVERIAEWLPREGIDCGFIVSERNRAACILTPEPGRNVKFLVMVEDCYYGFEETVPLGRVLADLGLTADDCARALEDWHCRLPTP